MDISTYRRITPLEIMDYLCNDSANGYCENEVLQLEKKLGLVLPTVLRQFLLKAGEECICVGEKKIFALNDFRRQDEYLVIKKITKQERLGILLNDISEENPQLYIQNRQGEGDIFAESIEVYLIIELDRRIRKVKITDDIDYPMRRYWCVDFLCRELTNYMEPSEIYIFPEEKEETTLDEEEEEDIDEDWDEEDIEDWDEEDIDEYWDEEDIDEDWDEEDMESIGIEKEFLLGELKDFLLAKRVSLSQQPYSVSICWDEKTSILYSAHFPRSGQEFASLLQIKVDRAAFPGEKFLAPDPYYTERLLAVLAEGVHNPVMAHCLTKEQLLPKNVRLLADEELHTWLANTIGDFLELFDKNKSWKIGIYVSGTFIECSKIVRNGVEELLEYCWVGRHLKSNPPSWVPSFTRPIKEGQEAPKALEPFVKELIYRVHDYNLLNRYAFLARKIVTNSRFSNLTKNYTEEERFALLSFYREIADGIMECIFDCLEKKAFSIRLNGKDFLELCSNPLVHLEGWMCQYGRESLEFLDKGCWHVS